MGPALLGSHPKKITNIKQLRRGDHIFTDRNKRTYFHHGIFVGDEEGDENYKVIHFTRVNASDYPALPEDKCSHYPPDTTVDDTSGVRMCCMDCFLKGHSLYQFEYGKGSLAALRTTCSATKCDKVETVMKRATDLLRDNNFGRYDFKKNNCETFAYFCKTGDKDHLSKQVRRARLLGGALGAALGAGVFYMVWERQDQYTISSDEMSGSEVESPT